MPPVSALLIGAGNRGRQVYGAYALRFPERLRLVGVAEPHVRRRETLRMEHEIPESASFETWPALLDAAPGAEAAIIATPDTEHVEPALAALERGYHVLLEKPIAPTPEDCVRVVEAAERAGRALQIGHVLRHSDFYRRAHELVSSGRLGRPLHLDLREHVAYWHMTHSYVRGKFRNTELAAPFVLAKSCHDLDLLVWLAGQRVRRVASFGSLSNYVASRAPEGAPARCTDGCPVQSQCPHDAERFYLGPDERVAAIWPWSDLSSDPSHAARRHALETGPYGRCAFRCDNDVADHQLVSVELQDGATASLAVHGVASHETRTLRISGSEGELRGRLDSGDLAWTRHGGLEPETLRVEGSPLGHYGGDLGLLHHFTRSLQDGDTKDFLASGRTALESHLLGFAAERARHGGRVLEMAEFRRELRTG